MRVYTKWPGFVPAIKRAGHEPVLIEEDDMKHMDKESTEKMKDKERGPGESMPAPKHEQSSDVMNECKTTKCPCPTGK